MYRISAYVVRNSTILMRQVTPVEVRIASLSRSPVPQYYKKIRERTPCPPPPTPCLPPYKFNFYVIATGALLVLTGGFMVYAKGNSEVRDWITIHAPWFDNLIAVLYEENVPLSKGLAEYLTYFKEIFDDYFKEIPEECYKQPPPVTVAQKAPIVFETCEGEDEDDEEEEEEEEEDQTACIPQEPVRTADVCKFEECLKETAEELVKYYQHARDACICFDKTVESNMTIFTIEGMKELKAKQDERNAVLAELKTKIEDADERFDNLLCRMKCGIEAPDDRIEAIKQKGCDYSDIVLRNKGEFQIAWENARQRDKQWKMVECLLDNYVGEVEALYPELKLSDARPMINGDFDYLLIHTKKYIDKLTAQLEETVYDASKKINRSRDFIDMPDNQFNAKVQTALKKAKLDMVKKFTDREIQIKKNGEDALKKKLEDQKQILDERFKIRLEEKCKELDAKSKKLIAEKVGNERKKLTFELNKMMQRLRLIEAKLEERLNAERETRRAAQLYAASTSLLNATAKGDPRIKVDKEIEILRKNSTNDTLVETVLNAIPSEVIDKGLVPESVVRDKFYSMEDLAMKVSMVERQGGPLPMYAISWLQSKFLFMKPIEIPQVELDNPPKEFKEHVKDFDTFDLLQRARYFMSIGNLASAVRYVDALDGASRGAAESWYQAANALLQTRQAAQAIIAHAAAITLKYL